MIAWCSLTWCIHPFLAPRGNKKYSVYIVGTGLDSRLCLDHFFGSAILMCPFISCQTLESLGSQYKWNFTGATSDVNVNKNRYQDKLPSMFISCRQVMCVQDRYCHVYPVPLCLQFDIPRKPFTTPPHLYVH